MGRAYFRSSRTEPSDTGEGRQLRLRAADGYEIGAVFYAALRPRAPRRVAVLHGGAGIPALRYRRFATFLAEWGIPVLTYDYRGIGLSRPPALRGFEATIEDWAEYDAAAAIAWLRERFPRDEILGISHSIGCLALGGAANAGEQARIVLVGAHTGYYGDYRPLYRLPMAVAWHGLMPALTRFVGYFPADRLGLGEDLPAGMALEWAERRQPDLRPNGAEPAGERRLRLLDHCAALECPAIAISISDDAFATVDGTRRLLSYFPRLSSPQLLQFTPPDAQVRRIGHFGFFRRAVGTTLWPRLLAQLDPARTAEAQPAMARDSGSATAS
ncbi:MAG TPA: alpha/beta fold hydrolase [Burkholderiales bacterium]|nr:alpha/beta fold hydrolase [Burkholderiales bacterium]